jgi:hypothetical protein
MGPKFLGSLTQGILASAFLQLEMEKRSPVEIMERTPGSPRINAWIAVDNVSRCGSLTNK